MKVTDAVSQSPNIMSGEPVFSGTRVPISHLFAFIEDGATVEEFLRSFPTVCKEQAALVLHDAFDSYVLKRA